MLLNGLVVERIELGQGDRYASNIHYSIGLSSVGLNALRTMGPFIGAKGSRIAFYVVAIRTVVIIMIHIWVHQV